MRVIVYIDGFNLYKGLLQGTPYRWLDLKAFCTALLPGLQVDLIRYFTARVQAITAQQQPFRQQLYWRALETLDNVEIIQGFFRVKPRTRIRVIPPLPDGTTHIRTTVSNEKGTDANIAAYLIHDAHRDLYDCAVLITNDADFVLPVRIVQEELGKTVWLVKPRIGQYSAIDDEVQCCVWPPLVPGCALLQYSQFPDILSDTTGRMIRKPIEWTADYISQQQYQTVGDTS